MAIKLIIESLEPDLKRDDLVCEQSLITFGRSKSCTVELNNIHVSKRHFLIRFLEGAYILMDEGSNLGTTLDGDMLEPLKSYVLHEQHQIEVPGFTISIFNDGHAPRLERTIVVARKLIGQILEDAQSTDQLPRLEDKDGRYLFLFNNDQASFVLGSSARLDFVIAHDQDVAKEHVSFIRDIFGVRLIPLMDAMTKVSEQEILEPYLLQHGDRIEIGQTKFLFKEHADEALCHPALTAQEEQKPGYETDTLTKEEDPMPALTNKKYRPLRRLDSIFLGLFVLVTLGASFMFMALV